MKINIVVPNSMHVAAMTQPWEYQLSGPDVLQCVAAADRFGYHKCMLGEHFVIPQHHLELSGDHYMHTTVALGCIAGQTKNIRLSTSINLLPLQNPMVQAKAWSTLDWLSGGRIEPMFGVGWLKEEFDLLGVPFESRGKMSDEYLAAMIELWTSEKPEFEGEFVNFKDIGFAPKPVQKHVPIWMGGDAKPALRRIARFADGWSPHLTRPEQFAECIDYIKSQPDYNGRDIEIFYALAMLNIGEDHAVVDDERAFGSRNKQKLIDQISGLKAVGVTETNPPVPQDIKNMDDYIDWLQWFAEEVTPEVS
jgi:probable F420-dependent oxidoreductase